MKKNIQSLRILVLVAFSAVGNLFSTALAQDTLCIYHGGVVVYKRAVLQIDSMSYIPQVVEVTGKDTQTAVVDVTNPVTGKTWMDRNLGAGRAAISSSDAEAYGDLYQWGRAADGHEKRNSLISETLSSGDAPGHGSFIVSPTLPYDWRSPQNNDLWQGVNGTNNPCPAGYRLPTVAEINAERTSWSSNDAAGAFASPLKITLAGYRKASNATLNVVGSYGFYWSGNVHTTGAQYLNLRSNNAYTSYDSRAGGYSVRCLKDN